MFIFVLPQAYAQDPIHTQFFMIPETLSSSFTGAKKSTRAGIIHRTQWPGLNFSLNTQFAFVDNWFDKFNSGIGISVLNHQETTTRYSFTQVNLNYAYHFPISSEWNARPSISFGYGAKNFGFQNLLLEDQINISNNSIDSSSDPLMFQNKRTFFDFNSSILFHNEDSWFGVTLRHLNKPNISLTNNDNMPLDIFMSIHAKYYFPIFEQYLDQYDIPLEIKYLAIVESALRPKIKSRVGATGLWQFMYGTGKEFDLKVSDLKSNSRKQSIVMARGVSVYLSRELLGVSFLKIGSYLGNRDHSTIMHANRKIEKLISSDSDSNDTDSAIQSIVFKLKQELTEKFASQINFI